MLVWPRCLSDWIHRVRQILPDNPLFDGIVSPRSWQATEYGVALADGRPSQMMALMIGRYQDNMGLWDLWGCATVTHAGGHGRIRLTHRRQEPTRGWQRDRIERPHTRPVPVKPVWPPLSYRPRRHGEDYLPVDTGHMHLVTMLVQSPVPMPVQSPVPMLVQLPARQAIGSASPFFLQSPSRPPHKTDLCNGHGGRQPPAFDRSPSAQRWYCSSIKLHFGAIAELSFPRSIMSCPVCG